MGINDWLDFINGTVGNAIALAALIVAIRRKPRHKK